MIDKTGFVDIPDYEGLYAINRQGDIWSRYSNKILKQWLTLGYPYITLCKEAEKHKKRVGRLVALTFIPNPDNKPEVNHKNGIKTDSFDENLEWVTGSENKKHAYDTGLRLGNGAIRAMTRARRKLSLSDAEAIKRLYETGNYFYRELGVMFSVSLHAIYRIVKNKTYKEAV